MTGGSITCIASRLKQVAVKVDNDPARIRKHIEAKIAALHGELDALDAASALSPTSPTATTRPAPSPCRWIASSPTSLAVAAASAGVVIATATNSAPMAGADDKYTQTWPKPYDQTTCLEYRTKMTAKQAWVMAADMLTSARNIAKKVGLPPDAMVSDFADQLQTACEPEIAAREPMTDVATTVFLLDRALKAPHFQP